MAYSTLPSNTSIPINPFKVSIPDDDISRLIQLLNLSKLPPKTYESSFADNRFGVSNEWMTSAKSQWESSFNWRKHEETINAFPHFIATVDDQDRQVCLHFVALFSRNPAATNTVFLHGWPGSFLEFIPILTLLTQKYTPDTLPYNIIVPSLPGFGFSTGPPLDRDFGADDITRLINKLMVGLGFGDTGYVAQGGDIGAKICRLLAVGYKECKAVHLNFCSMGPPKGFTEELSALEKTGLERGNKFMTSGCAYQAVHGTRPSTIDFALSTNPVALLAWIGEKYLAWTDEDPSIDTILEAVSLYWFSPNNFSNTVYTYRSLLTPPPKGRHDDPALHITKPFGYSHFPKDVFPAPIGWVRTTGNLVWEKSHTEGGHFAALEKPDVLLADVEDFLTKVAPLI